VPLQRYFEVFVFLSQFFPYTRQFSTSLSSIIVLSPDICQCTVSGQTCYTPACYSCTISPCSDGRQHLLSDDCPRSVLLSFTAQHNLYYVNTVRR
jgi:hypothetical protein